MSIERHRPSSPEYPAKDMNMSVTLISHALFQQRLKMPSFGVMVIVRVEGLLDQAHLILLVRGVWDSTEYMICM